MENKQALYGWIAIGLAVALIIVAALWYNTRQNLDTLSRDLRDYRRELSEKCSPTAGPEEVRNDADCIRLLADLADLLKQYQDRLEDLDIEGTQEEATTTGTTTQ